MERKITEKPGYGVLKVVQKFFPQVTSVVDATRPQFIEVMKRDAQSKGVKDHKECAMAVACKRQLNLDGVIISRSVAYMIKGKQARRFKLPESVSREVVSFDRKGEFMPGKYKLSSVPKTAKLGAQKVGVKSGRSLGAPKKFRHLTTNVRHVLGGQEPEGK